MTLRQQLTEIVVGDISDQALDSQQLIRKRAQYKIDQLLGVCQEIAREARLDEADNAINELAKLKVYDDVKNAPQMAVDIWNHMIKWQWKRDAELTQKPPHQHSFMTSGYCRYANCGATEKPPQPMRLETEQGGFATAGDIDIETDEV